jgi:hypothetical protein
MTHIPNLFLVGAMKAGTTSLYHILKAHPEIYFCPIKEPNYFAADLPFANPPALTRKPNAPHPSTLERHDGHFAVISDREAYLSLFRDAGSERYLGEASTSYLLSSEAPQRIFRDNPDAKILIVLRDPIARAYSQYQMDYTIGRIREPFLDVIGRQYSGIGHPTDNPFGYINASLYSTQVRRYLNIYSRRNICILMFEELKSGPAELLRTLSAFLDIDLAGFRYEATRHNKNIRPRSAALNTFLHRSSAKDMIRRLIPRALIDKAKRIYYSEKSLAPLTAAERSALSPYFKDDIIALSALIDRDLSHWLA